MTLKFDNDSLATFSETFAYPREYPNELERSLEIVGERGVIFIDFTGESPRFFSDSGPSALSPEISRPVPDAFARALRAETGHFLQCVRTGEIPVPGGREGMMALRIALAAGKSAAAGRAVEL